MKTLPSIENYQKYYAMLAYSVWSWFAPREQRLRKKAVDKNPSELLELSRFIVQSFEEICGDLHPMFTMERLENGKIVMDFRPRLRSYYFVETLIKNAPNLQYWKAAPLETKTVNDTGWYVHFDHRMEVRKMEYSVMYIPEKPDQIDVVIYGEFTDGSDLVDRLEEDVIMQLGFSSFITSIIGNDLHTYKITNLGYDSFKERPVDAHPIKEVKADVNKRYQDYLDKYAGIYFPEELDEFETTLSIEDGREVITTVNKGALHNIDKLVYPFYISIYVQKLKSEPKEPNADVEELLDEVVGLIKSYIPRKNGNTYVRESTLKDIRTLNLFCHDFRQPILFLDYLKQLYRDKVELSFYPEHDPDWEQYTNDYGVQS